MFKLERALKTYSEAGSLNAQVNFFGFIDDHTFLTKSGELGLVLSDRYFFVTCRVLPQCERLSEADFALLAGSVQSRRTQHHFLLTTWVFLPDHWHAILMPPYPSTVSGLMESVKVSSTRQINKLRGDKGVLWQGRFLDRALRT
jgi:REP element-mobilizing transposase RayT